jgi:phosphoglycerate dehydrogenase-like enzyme
MITVAVTEQEFDKARHVFAAAGEMGITCIRAPGEEEPLAAAVRTHGAAHVIVGVRPYVGPLYDALPSGGVIARYGVGHDGIDKERATQRGLYCVNTPGVLDDSVAEFTLALLLAAARHAERDAAALRGGLWKPSLGLELRGRTLAVIGCGAIGCRVAAKASFGFSMDVVGCETARIDTERLRVRHGFTQIYGDFARAVEGADFVSLHIPSTPRTRHFINRERLALLPQRASLINTARGALVDEAALFDALSAETLAGAALDVFEHEPYQPVTQEKDLRTLENVIMTPHIGSSTREACERMAMRALENLELAEAGRHREMDLLNPAALDAGRADESP